MHPDKDRSPTARGPASAPAPSASGRTPPSETVRVDFLVIGSGISGLSYALEAARHGTVAIVTKDVAYEGSTHYAQGGISAVIAEDDTVEAHVEDTHVAGDRLCDPAAVETVCREGRAAVQKLLEFGAEFTRDERGDLHLAREGGHSEKRIVHADDMTGKEIERAARGARAHENVFYEFHAARDLVMATTIACDGDGNRRSCDETTRCVGAETTRRADGARLTFLAPCVLLAAGRRSALPAPQPLREHRRRRGGGRARRARREHGVCPVPPRLLYQPRRRARMRPGAFRWQKPCAGHGGRLFDNADGRDAVLEKYDDRMELTPRTSWRAPSTARSKPRSGGKEAACVWLDVTHLDADDTLRAFPGVAAELRARGVDVTAQRIPVTPAAHYLCGGVVTDLHGATSVEGLFACGENAYTGVHGANRLASNSLLEAAVFADRAALASKRRLDEFGESLRPTLDAVQACVERGEAERAAAGRVARVDAMIPKIRIGEHASAAFDDETWSSAARRLARAIAARGDRPRTRALLGLVTRSLLRLCGPRCARGNGGGCAHETRNLIVCGRACFAARRRERRAAGCTTCWISPSAWRRSANPRSWSRARRTSTGARPR